MAVGVGSPDKGARTIKSDSKHPHELEALRPEREELTAGARDHVRRELCRASALFYREGTQCFQ